MLTWLLFLGSKIAVNELCGDWVTFLCLVPPCAVQTRPGRGRAAYPTSHRAAVPARAPGCPVQLGAALAQPLVSISTSLRFVTTSVWQALHWTSCLLSEPRMVFKYVNILCVRDKLLKQLVKGVIQVVLVSLVYLAVLFVMAQFFILLHNFQDQWEKTPPKCVFKHKLRYFWIWQIRVLSCNQLVRLSEHTDWRAENK